MQVTTKIFKMTMVVATAVVLSTMIMLPSLSSPSSPVAAAAAATATSVATAKTSKTSEKVVAQDHVDTKQEPVDGYLMRRATEAGDDSSSSSNKAAVAPMATDGGTVTRKMTNVEDDDDYHHHHHHHELLRGHHAHEVVDQSHLEKEEEEEGVESDKGTSTTTTTTTTTTAAADIPEETIVKKEANVAHDYIRGGHHHHPDLEEHVDRDRDRRHRHLDDTNVEIDESGTFDEVSTLYRRIDGVSCSTLQTIPGRGPYKYSSEVGPAGSLTAEHCRQVCTELRQSCLGFEVSLRRVPVQAAAIAAIAGEGEGGEAAPDEVQTIDETRWYVVSIKTSNVHTTQQDDCCSFHFLSFLTAPPTPVNFRTITLSQQILESTSDRF